MTEKIAIELGNVQKTLFLPLWGRAYETRKEKPLLVDKTAAAIIDKVDYDFSTITRKMNPLSQLAWIMRSIYIDEVIKGFLARYPRATVVNIGCGLDTTFDRINNDTLLWYDLDLPDVMSLRKKFIQETERRKFISSSFLEEGWLDGIRIEEAVLFIAAGVFYYFEGDEIKQFFVRLADRFPGAELFFDVCSPYGLKVANKMVIKSSGLDERSFLKWGLDKPQMITSWHKRLRILKIYYYFMGEKARHFNLKTRWYGFLSDRLKIQYMIHLAILK
jgi:O-methyltransferase involved in polyketide biosynthesis